MLARSTKLAPDIDTKNFRFQSPIKCAFANIKNTNAYQKYCFAIRMSITES